MTGVRHEERRKFLDALAVLCGYPTPLVPGLPDGRVPDVIRMNGRTRGLFIGEAKDSETSGNTETRKRLAEYLAWFMGHLGAGGEGVFSVCCGRACEAEAWRLTLDDLSRQAGREGLGFQVDVFASDLVVVWAGPVSAMKVFGKSIERPSLSTDSQGRI